MRISRGDEIRRMRISEGEKHINGKSRITTNMLQDDNGNLLETFLIDLLI